MWEMLEGARLSGISLHPWGAHLGAPATSRSLCFLNVIFFSSPW